MIIRVEDKKNYEINVNTTGKKKGSSMNVKPI